MKTILLSFLFCCLVSCELEYFENSLAGRVDKSKILNEINKARIHGYAVGDILLQPVGKINWNDELERAAIASSIYIYENGKWDDNIGDKISATNFKGSAHNVFWLYNCQSLPEEEIVRHYLDDPDNCPYWMSAGITEFAAAQCGNYWTIILGSKN